jgi:tetratricopeptide (TPR) repeat protein
MKTIRLMTMMAVVLLTTLANAQTTFKTEKHGPVYYPDKEMSKIKAEIAEILKKDIAGIYDKKNGDWVKAKDILVLDDRIEFMVKNQRTVINFSDLFDYTIEVGEVSMTGEDGKYYLNNYELDLGDFLIRFHKKFEPASQMANDLFFIQHQLRRNRFSSQLALFKPIAEKYRALKVKPPVSEEQRKYIVQANSFNQQKQYYNAIQLYNKAIETDPTSYPAAYSNLALLSAQVQKFDAAIYYMNEYLLLEPEASDARSAQDKIYEWEIMMQK